MGKKVAVVPRKASAPPPQRPHTPTLVKMQYPIHQVNDA